MTSTISVEGRVDFTYSAGEWVFGTIEIHTPEPCRIWMGDYFFRCDVSGWQADLIRECCQLLHCNGVLDDHRCHDITLEVFGSGKRLETIGLRRFTPTAEVLAGPIEPSAIAPAVQECGNIVFLASASPEEMLAAAVRELVVGDPYGWGRGKYARYGSELGVYNECDASYCLLPSGSIPAFDQAWANEMIDSGEAEGCLGSLDEEDLEEIENGRPLNPDEMKCLEEGFWSGIEEQGNEHPSVEVFTAVKHTNANGRFVVALWELGGYSFDGFSADLINIYDNFVEIDEALKSWGRLV